MIQTEAQTYAEARGFHDWSSADAEDQSSALLRAADYIAARYRLRTLSGPADQSIYDAAQFLIARDLLTNPAPLPTRATAQVAKESKEMTGVGKKAVEYADAPVDPYPLATSLLGPLTLTTGGVTFGRMVR